MSDEELFCARLLIEPEPTPAELVAILFSRQAAPVAETEKTPRARWSEVARREQLRSPLEDRKAGWNQ